MAVYWLDVSNVNRRDHAPGTFTAHTDYITNHGGPQKGRSAASLSVNLPRNRHAMLRFAKAYELYHKRDRSPVEEKALFKRNQAGRCLADELPEGLKVALRQDARWCYKIMHALPTELGTDHQIEATRRFVWLLTGRGRACAFASFHDLDTHNPHVHIEFIDRDFETGRSVALLSAKASERRARGLEPNSTEWLRQLWEIECNGVLAEQGLEVRIDRRSNLERGLVEGEKKRGWQEALAVHPDAPTEALEAAAVDEINGAENPAEPDDMARLPIVTIENVRYYADERLGELRAVNNPGEKLPYSHIQYAVVEPSLGHLEYQTTELNDRKSRFRFALDTAQELDALRGKRAELARLQQRSTEVTASLTELSNRQPEITTERLVAEDRAKVAAAYAAQYQRGNKLRGFELFGWKSPTRRMAERTRDEAYDADLKAVRMVKADEEVNRHLGHLRQEQADVEQSVVQTYNEMRQRYGTEQELDEVEQHFDQAIGYNIRDLTADQLQEMYDVGEIGLEELKAGLHLLGESEALALVEEQHEAYRQSLN